MVLNPSRFLLLIGFLCAGLVLAGCTQEDPSADTPPAPDTSLNLDVPYIPTPDDAVAQMLELAEVGPTDVVYDLGSGDGRIVIMAAQRYGAHGVGIEIDPYRVYEARLNAIEAGVDNRVSFREQDLFEADFSEATVVTLYLLPGVNRELRPLLFDQLAPGTRIVSHNFGMGAWTPDSTVQVGPSEVHLWTLPETPPDSLRPE